MNSLCYWSSNGPLLRTWSSDRRRGPPSTRSATPSFKWQPRPFLVSRGRPTIEDELVVPARRYVYIAPRCVAQCVVDFSCVACLCGASVAGARGGVSAWPAPSLLECKRMYVCLRGARARGKGGCLLLDLGFLRGGLALLGAQPLAVRDQPLFFLMFSWGRHRSFTKVQKDASFLMPSSHSAPFAAVVFLAATRASTLERAAGPRCCWVATACLQVKTHGDCARFASRPRAVRRPGLSGRRFGGS